MRIIWIFLLLGTQPLILGNRYSVKKPTRFTPNLDECFIMKNESFHSLLQEILVDENDKEND